MGVDVEAVTGVRDLADPESAPALVGAAVERFGRVDAAVAFSGQIVTGRFLELDGRGPAHGRHRLRRGAVPLPQGGGGAR